jgi:hypothetical protein
MGSRLSTASTQVKTTLSHLKSSEVAEALIATWCVEFLRVRRVGGFNVAQIMAISILMLVIKQIILEASRRNGNGETRVIVSNWDAPVPRRRYGGYRSYRDGQ